MPVIAPELYFRAALWKHRERADALRRPRRHVSPRLLRRVPAGDVAARPAAALPTLRRPLPPARRGASDLEREHRAARASSSTPRRKRRSQDVVPKRLLGSLFGERGLAAVRAARRTCCGGEYADLLWEPVSRGEGPGRLLERARDDGRPPTSASSSGLMRAGKSLLVFPEGRPSPDGEIGPLRRGLDALVRRGKPERILPVDARLRPARPRAHRGRRRLRRDARRRRTKGSRTPSSSGSRGARR